MLGKKEEKYSYYLLDSKLSYEETNMRKGLPRYRRSLTRGWKASLVLSRCSHYWLYYEEQVYELASQMSKEHLWLSRKTHIISLLLLFSEWQNDYTILFVDDLVADIYLEGYNGFWWVFLLTLLGSINRWYNQLRFPDDR